MKALNSTRKSGGAGSIKRFGVNIIAVGRKRYLPKLNHEVGVGISPDRVLIKCAEPIKERTRLGLDLMLARGGLYKNFKAAGRVEACIPGGGARLTYHLDVKFVGMASADRKKIGWYLG